MLNDKTAERFAKLLGEGVLKALRESGILQDDPNGPLYTLMREQVHKVAKNAGIILPKSRWSDEDDVAPPKSGLSEIQADVQLYNVLRDLCKPCDAPDDYSETYSSCMFCDKQPVCDFLKRSEAELCAKSVCDKIKMFFRRIYQRFLSFWNFNGCSGPPC